MEKTAEKIAAMVQGVLSEEDAEKLVEYAILNMQNGSEVLTELGVESFDELSEEKREAFSKLVASKFNK